MRHNCLPVLEGRLSWTAGVALWSQWRWARSSSGGRPSWPPPPSPPSSGPFCSSYQTFWLKCCKGVSLYVFKGTKILAVVEYTWGTAAALWWARCCIAGNGSTECWHILTPVTLRQCLLINLQVFFGPFLAESTFISIFLSQWVGQITKLWHLYAPLKYYLFMLPWSIANFVFSVLTLKSA